MADPAPAPAASPFDGTKQTAYGYRGDATPDSNSAHGIGDHDNKLSPYFSVALTHSQRSTLFNVNLNSKSTGNVFSYKGAQYRDDDTAPESDKRIDVYSPNHAPDPGHENDTLPAARMTQNNWDAFRANHVLPYAPMVKVATPDDVTAFDGFVNNGGDVNKIPVYDQLAVAVAKDPNFLTKPENYKLFQELVQKPQEQSYDPGKVVGDAMNTFFPNLLKAGQDVGHAIINTLAVGESAAAWQVKKSTGWNWNGKTPDQEAGTWAQLTANANAGYGQTLADMQNLVEGSFVGVLNGLGKPLINALPLTPEAKQAAEDQRSQLLQGYAGDQVSMGQYARGSQTAMAGLYAQMHGAGQVATQLANDKADPAVASGMSALAQFGIPEAVGEGIVAGSKFAVRPTFFEQGLYQTEKTGAAVGKSAAANMLSIVPEAGTDAEKLTAQAATKEATEASRVAGQEADAAHADLQQVGAGIQKLMQQPNTVPTMMGQLMQVGGKSMQMLGNLPHWIEHGTDWLAGKATMANPDLKPMVKAMIGYGIEGGLEHLAGPAGAIGGMATMISGPVFRTLGDLLSAGGKELTYGMTSLPYWQRVAEGTKGMARGLALHLDNSFVYTAADVAKGGAAGAATGAVMGAAQNPNDPLGGAIQGIGMGGIFGMAGGGFGQWRKFGDPTSLIQESRGDWNRYRSVLNSADQKSFDSLDAKNQIAVSSFMQHFPGLQVEYYNKPNDVSGYHTVNADGRSVVGINTAPGHQSVAPLLAHELGHQAAHNGVLPEIYNSLLGNPETGQIGQFTQLDANGKAVGIDSETGRYRTNQDFQNFKNQYVNKIANSGQAVSHLNDFNIAREVYSEHAADHLLSGNALADAKSAFDPAWAGSPSTVKNAMAKLGIGFNVDGDVVHGTGLFQGLQRNADLDGLLRGYYQTKKKWALSHHSDDVVDRNFSDNDLRDPNIRGTSLDSAPQFQRNADGSVVLDKGRPVFRTSGEVTTTNREMANTAHALVSNLSDDAKMDIGHRQTGDTHFVRYLPDHVVDQILAKNENNTTQAGNFRLINKNLADSAKGGQEYNIFYHKATMKGRYGQFAGLSRDMVPYGIEFTKDGNINFKSVDFQQLTDNYLKNQNRPGVKGVWNGPQDFINDADIYFTNHQNGVPGETNLGVDKKNAINALGKFGTKLHAELNPLTGELKGNPIVKSFRLDRINRVRPLDQLRPFTDEAQYRKMSVNFRPKDANNVPESEWDKMKAGEEIGNDGHPEAIPAIIGNPDAKDKIQKVDYGIATSPLLGTKGDMIRNVSQRTQVPQTIGQDRMDSQFKFLTQTDKNKLQVLASNGAVKKLGDAMVDDIMKAKENPQIAAGMGWYSRMRDAIKNLFTDKAERFTQFLGATSAQTPVDENFLQAVEAHEMAEAGNYDRHVAEYRSALAMQNNGTLLQHSLDQGYKNPVTDKKGEIVGWKSPKTDAQAMSAYLIGKDAVPLRPNGKKFNANSMQVLKVLNGSWLDDVQAPKTPNFAGNLSGRTTQATIDVWAARYLRRLSYEGQTDGEPWRILPKSEAGVGDLDFAFSQLVMEHAAGKLGMKAPDGRVGADDLQAVAWFAEKHHWDERGWTGNVGAEKSSFDDVFNLMYGGAKPLNASQGRAAVGVKRATNALEYAKQTAARVPADKKAASDVRNKGKALTLAQSDYDAIMK